MLELNQTSALPSKTLQSDRGEHIAIHFKRIDILLTLSLLIHKHNISLIWYSLISLISALAYRFYTNILTLYLFHVFYVILNLRYLLQCYLNFPFLLFAYHNAIDFYILPLYSATFLNPVINYIFFLDSLEFSRWAIISLKIETLLFLPFQYI